MTVSRNSCVIRYFVISLSVIKCSGMHHTNTMLVKSHFTAIHQTYVCEDHTAILFAVLYRYRSLI